MLKCGTCSRTHSQARAHAHGHMLKREHMPKRSEAARSPTAVVRPVRSVAAGTPAAASATTGDLPECGTYVDEEDDRRDEARDLQEEHRHEKVHRDRDA